MTVMTDPIAEILEENERRNALNSRKFDPVSGEGSTGGRFLFAVKGLPEAWLPESIRCES